MAVLEITRAAIFFYLKSDFLFTIMTICHKMVKIGKSTEDRMEKEVWKDIPGFDGVYQVSTLGRARSVDRKVDVITPTRRNSGFVRTNVGTVLSIEKAHYGFNYVRLYKEGVKVRLPLHRLIAHTFLENPNNCKYVGFKDGDKDNMGIKNLYWTNKKRRNLRNVSCCEVG